MSSDEKKEKGSRALIGGRCPSTSQREKKGSYTRNARPAPRNELPARVSENDP